MFSEVRAIHSIIGLETSGRGSLYLTWFLMGGMKTKKITLFPFTLLYTIFHHYSLEARRVEKTLVFCHPFCFCIFNCISYMNDLMFKRTLDHNVLYNYQTTRDIFYYCLLRLYCPSLFYLLPRDDAFILRIA